MGPEWIWLLFLFAFGSCIGSFLNVVIYRLPRDKSIVTPPSACPSCEKRIRFYDNIPLLSWLLLRGKCRFCGERISPRYFIIELFTALMFVGVYLLFFELGCRKLGIEPQGQFPGAMDEFFSGGWLFYLACMVLLSAFLAGSAIDLELATSRTRIITPYLQFRFGHDELVKTRFVQLPKSSKSEYITGVRIRVRNVANESPAITAIAIGPHHAACSPPQ